MKTVVLVPALNEEKTIGGVISSIRKSIPCKIIVVDDASTDATRKILRRKGVKVVCLAKRVSLAEVFRQGLGEALKLEPGIIVHIDSDGQYSPKDIPELIRPILEHEADLVLGSRFRGEIESMSFLRYWGNVLFSLMISLLIGQRITDSQTGFRAFTLDVAKKIRIISTYTYTQEMLIRAGRAEFVIQEVPIRFSRREYGLSRLISNPFIYGVRAVLDIAAVLLDNPQKVDLYRKER